MSTSWDYANGIYGTESLEDSIRFRENFLALALLLYSTDKDQAYTMLRQFEAVRVPT